MFLFRPAQIGLTGELAALSPLWPVWRDGRVGALQLRGGSSARVCAGNRFLSHDLRSFLFNSNIEDVSLLVPHVPCLRPEGGAVSCRSQTRVIVHLGFLRRNPPPVSRRGGEVERQSSRSPR